MKVFDESKIEGLKVSARLIVYDWPGDRREQTTEEILRDLSGLLASEVLRNQKFFHFTRDRLNNFVEYRADAIVLTRDEYAKLQQESFARGVHCEQMQGNRGFKPL